jgi:hypothetical protein
MISYYYFYYYFLIGVRLSPLGAAATTGLLYQPQMIGDCAAIGGMKTGREKTCHSATFFATNPT